MKRVINGKLYNTETANMLENYETRLGMNDFRYEDTTLYVTKKGNFFLSGKGHGMTRWAKSEGNCRGWGEGIEALTPREALEWLEQHNLTITDEYMNEYFKDLIEEA